jgi:hypothetical protein
MTAIFLRGTCGKRVKADMTTDLGTTTTYFVGAHYEVVVTGTGTQTNNYTFFVTLPIMHSRCTPRAYEDNMEKIL